jgi:hypothetical protein
MFNLVGSSLTIVATAAGDANERLWLRPLTPRSHAVNRMRQQEHKERKDADGTRKRHEERRKAHNLVWVQWEKEGLSLPTTPENTDNDSGVV